MHRWLLQRNARLPGIAFAVDGDGDVYLVGRLPLDAVTPQLDALLGALLETADGSFDTLLTMGFLTSMRRSGPGALARGVDAQPGGVPAPRPRPLETSSSADQA